MSKIVIIPRSLEFGGSLQRAIRLACGLRDTYGHDVEVWGLGLGDKVAALLDRVGMVGRNLPFRWSWGRWDMLANLRMLMKELRKTGCEVILPFDAVVNIRCGLIWRMAGARTCIWNQVDSGIDLQESRTVKWSIRNTPWFASNSEHAAQLLMMKFRVPPGRVSIIRNGVELAAPLKSRGEWRSRIGASEADCVVCMLANLHYPKDHETLIDAWAEVLRRHNTKQNRCFLILAGQEVSRLEMLCGRIGSLGLPAGSIQFLGNIEDVAGLLTASDMSVLSSRMEGCPNFLLESMLAGVPVLGTDIPGIREAVGPENCGYLAPPGDSEALAVQILNMIERLKDPVFKKELTDRNRERVRKEFSVEQMCRQYAKLIERALAQGTGKS